MCDCDQRRGYGWKGWHALPAAGIPRATGEWKDLSHPLNGDMPRLRAFPQPVFERIYSLPERPINVTRMEMVVHMGTHIDSPRHFFLDGPALEDVPLERLSGRGIVWPVAAGASGLIEPQALAPLEGRLQPGDILILNTGWHEFVGTPRYDDEHPSLSVAAADWMVEREVKLVGLDVPTPDLPIARRPKDFDYPIHRRLLSQGVLIAEHLTNLSGLDGKDVEVLCACLNITGADGAPARIVAREVDGPAPGVNTRKAA